MAWFVTMDSRNRGDEDETYLSPEIEIIPEEQERYETLGKGAALAIRQEYYDQGNNLYDYSLITINPYHPYFDPFPLPCMMEGWKWPIPDRPFRNKLKRKEGRLVDIIGTSFETFAVSQKVIDIIELIEPGVHQYLPYELIQRDGSVHPDTRWLLNVCTRAETIDYERSNVIPMRDHPHWIMDRSNDHHLVLRKEAVAGRALWYEYRYYSRPGVGAPFLVSDRFWDAFKPSKSVGLRPQNGTLGQQIEEV